VYSLSLAEKLITLSSRWEDLGTSAGLKTKRSQD